MFFMVVKKDSLTYLPSGIKRYVEEYFASGNIFGSEVCYAFLDHHFPVTKNCVVGRAPIPQKMFLGDVVITNWIFDQQENPHEGVSLFKL